MGYFSNGTEQGMYEEDYCDKCVHADDKQGCPVMNLHWIWNYDQCSDTEEGKAKAYGLNVLIPRDKDGWNQQCLMFKARRKIRG